MKKLRWQITIVLVTLVIVAVLLLSQQEATLIPILPQPAAGGIYTEALIGDPSRFNPLLDWNNQPDRDVNRLLFSGLMRFDARGLPVPDLAESWGVSQDGTIYNVALRPNAVWHDGSPVTADDVIFTVNLIQSQASFYPQDIKDLWAEVEIKKLSDKSLKFTLPEPYAPFLDYLTFGVLPQHILGNIPVEQIPNAPFNLAPVGSGPYKFERIIASGGKITGVALTAFDGYYGQKPFISQIVFRYYPDAFSALSAYQTGEVMGISQITPEILNASLAEPNLYIYTSRQPVLSLVLLNHNNPETPFFQDKDVRRAMVMGLNRQRLIDRLLNGQAIIANSPILPGSWAYYDGIETIGYDPEGAVALLKKAGYTLPAGEGTVRAKENQRLTFTLLYPDTPQHAALAQAIQQDWQEIGIEVKLQPMPYEQLITGSLTSRTYQAALVDLNLTRTPDPDPYPFWHQAEATGGQNYAQWDNRPASEYLEQARIQTDINVRTRLYRNFQVVFSAEQPAVLLYYPVYSYGVNAEVQGVQIPPLYDPSDRLSNLPEWYLITRRALEKATVTPAP
jgi:peptide/nickel transport system substrate-binding protein